MARRRRPSQAGPYTPKSGPYRYATFPSYRQYLNRTSADEGFANFSERSRARKENPEAAGKDDLVYWALGSVWVRQDGVNTRQPGRGEHQGAIKTHFRDGTRTSGRISLECEVGQDGQTLTGDGQVLVRLKWVFEASPGRCAPQGWAGELELVLLRNELPTVLGFSMRGEWSDEFEAFVETVEEALQSEEDCNENGTIDGPGAWDALETWGFWQYR